MADPTSRPLPLSRERLAELREFRNWCDPECEDRCVVCPNDARAELVAELDRYEALLGTPAVRGLPARLRYRCDSCCGDPMSGGPCPLCQAADLLAALLGLGGEHA